MVSKLDDDQRQQVLEIAGHQGKLAAVKMYKDLTGASLFQAKTAVEALLLSEDSSEPDQEIQDQILEAIQRGETLEAIKLYCGSTGASLMVGKQFIENLTGELRKEDPSIPEIKKGCTPVLLAIIITAGVGIKMLLA